MAIGTSNAYTGPYTANGSTTAFPFTFTVLAIDQVSVILRDSNGVESTIAAADYTVTLAGAAPSTGTVTFDTAPASGNTVYILLDPAFTQDIEFADGAAWLAKPVNDGYDESALRDQVLKRDVARAVLAPIGEDSLSLPAAANRGSKFLAFDADGNVIMSSGTGADAGLRTDLAADDGDSLIGGLPSVSPERLGMTWLANDNSSALLTALNNLDGRVLDGGGRTYKLLANVVSTATGSKLRNIIFDISGITTGGDGLTISGSQGSTSNLTADTLAGSQTVAVASTAAYSANHWVYLGSNANIWSTTYKCGQMARVQSVDSPTQITLASPVRYDFKTADTATIKPLTLNKGVVLEDVFIVGANTGHQNGVMLKLCEAPKVLRGGYDMCDYAGLSLYRCWAGEIRSTSFARAYEVGYAYGIVVEYGCYNTKIAECTGDDLRHLVAHGGGEGFNIGTSVIDCKAYPWSRMAVARASTSEPRSSTARPIACGMPGSMGIRHAMT